MNSNQYDINNPNYKHGYRSTRLYNIWNNMKQRILNPNNKDYPNYGGRGITICNEWLNFIPFKDWALNNGYAEGLEIDREENGLGYNPDNCRWLTRKENMRKQPQVKLTQEIANEIRYLHNTDKYTQSKLAKKYNVTPQLISSIINNKSWKH